MTHHNNKLIMLLSNVAPPIMNVWEFMCKRKTIKKERERERERVMNDDKLIHFFAAVAVNCCCCYTKHSFGGESLRLALLGFPSLQLLFSSKMQEKANKPNKLCHFYSKLLFSHEQKRPSFFERLSWWRIHSFLRESFRCPFSPGISVTRLGDLLDFGQVFCNNYFALISHILGQFFKVTKSIIFLVKSFLGNFYRHLAIFSGHTAWDKRSIMFYYEPSMNEIWYEWVVSVFMIWIT